jgi:hypothetical protein
MGIGIKPGTQLRSAVCGVEVLVVKAPSGDVDLRCGGHPMVLVSEVSSEKRVAEPGFDEGTQLGKRYTDEAGTLDVLCVKPGPYSLSIGDAPLKMKVTKPLPSSD